ncbi:MAG: winged helix-turn-helix transcriptional regulator [Candidatus Nanoarchaeia archaeon]|nr:winged helix-turn-helix transcriptional regulator [Candidatus Nanoarchaeia archaeon]
MKEIDQQELLIIKELVKDPRISDNQISKKTKVPVKTVNRKRKLLEKSGIISYYTNVDNTVTGTEKFGARQQYIITFKHGITRSRIFEAIKNDIPSKIELKHVSDCAIGDKDGHAIVAITIESRVEGDIIEVFNAEILPKLKRLLGDDAVIKTDVITLNSNLIVMHNYMPLINMRNGKIKEEWSDDLIFAD